VILDVDTGIDDALAILFAVRHPGIDVLGISCVAGNAPLAQVVDNTLRILDAADAPDIPVAAGAVRPLIEPARAARHVHGRRDRRCRAAAHPAPGRASRRRRAHAPPHPRTR
jgi:pyrimidine-specific ribonucleoside hydrolase